VAIIGGIALVVLTGEVAETPESAKADAAASS
jgi:hypothetical protein